MSKPKTDKVHQWQKLVDDINSYALGQYYFACKFGKGVDLEALIKPNWRRDVLVKAEEGKATKKLKEHQLRNLQAFAKDLQKRGEEDKLISSLNKIQREPEANVRLVELIINLKYSLQRERQFKAEFNRNLENQKKRLKRGEARTVKFIESLESNFFPKTRCKRLIQEIQDGVGLQIAELKGLKKGMGHLRTSDSMRLFIGGISDLFSLDRIDGRRRVAELLRLADIRSTAKGRYNFFEEGNIRRYFREWKDEEGNCDSS